MDKSKMWYQTQVLTKLKTHENNPSFAVSPTC